MDTSPLPTAVRDRLKVEKALEESSALTVSDLAAHFNCSVYALKISLGNLHRQEQAVACNNLQRLLGSVAPWSSVAERNDLLNNTIGPLRVWLSPLFAALVRKEEQEESYKQAVIKLASEPRVNVAGHNLGNIALGPQSVVDNSIQAHNSTVTTNHVNSAVELKDPITEKAESVAEVALYGDVPGHKGIDGPEIYVREQIRSYASPRFQKEFIQALRVAMLNNIEEHRKECQKPDCGKMLNYRKLKMVLLDELDALTPHGVYTEDLDYAIITRLEQIRRELLDAINGGHERLLEADATVLGCVEEGFTELIKEKGTKASNTRAMLTKYMEKLGETVVTKAVIAPLVEEVGKAMG